MKVLVTGGAGFVGRALCSLLHPTHELVVVDNFSTARERSLPPEIDIVRLDLGSADARDLESLIRDVNPDAAVHLAAIHYIPRCMENPDETFAVNVRSTDVICRSLAETDCRRLVFTSTADVYAVTDDVHNEIDRPAPRNVYGLSKMLSEQIIEYASAVSDRLAATCLRLANVYGPYETNPHVIPDIIDRLGDRSMPALEMGYLGGARDFVHVSDVARAIAMAITADAPGFDVFNVGTGASTPVREVVKTLQTLVGDGRPIVEDQARFRQFDRRTLSVDVEHIRDGLGWVANVALAEGLKELVASGSHRA
jgi:UDP-glucose 4-epimerase